jgi:ABC-type Na+ efflux pump permease subunit
MKTFTFILLVVAMLAVLATLGMGVINMARGGDPHRANQLMQRRVLLQGLAIGIFAILLFMLRG